MKLVDFARDRLVEPQTVRIYMKHHGMEYDTEHGLTDEQIKELSEKYPEPAQKIVEQIEDATTKALLSAQDEIIRLQKQVQKLTEDTARMLLLEEKTQALTDTNREQAERIEKLKVDKAVSDKEQEHLQTKVTEQEQEIERLKSRNLWQRILNT